MGAYSKYALEMFTSIAQMECMLTSRLAEEVKWCFFVNWRGGPGNNMEDDLAQEISNRLSKSIVQRMGPNKSLKSISKVCKAANGIKEVKEQFDTSAGIRLERKSKDRPTRTPNVVFVVASHYQSLQIIVLLLQACPLEIYLFCKI